MLRRGGNKWGKFPPEVIPLSLADPDFLVADEIKNVLRKAVEREELFYKNDNVALEAMARKIRNRNGIDAKEEDIIITQGVNPAMWFSVNSTCKKGDEVIINDPMYQHFISSQVTTRTKPIIWELLFEEEYKFNIDRLNELITPKTKLIFLCNPHNPTGRVMTKEELEGVSEIAVDNGIYVMIDELWEDIIFDDREHITLASMNSDIQDLSITSWGFSKTFGVAGLRMGYSCVTNKDLLKKIRVYCTDISRSTSTLSKAAAPVMLDDTLDWWREGVMKHLSKMRTICEKKFDKMTNIEYNKLEGTYLIFPKFNYGVTTNDLYNIMLEKGKVATEIGTLYGELGHSHLRLCIATSEKILTEALNRMEKTLESL
jgi:bifunctional pyridoxal-dependent enzyme with beta-cystathionase and maltose regulon repressor activities